MIKISMVIRRISNSFGLLISKSLNFKQQDRYYLFRHNYRNQNLFFHQKRLLIISSSGKLSSGCDNMASKPWETNYRIPDNTIPLHYDVYLFPNLENQTFSGKVSILIKTTEPRDFFVSHIQYLKVTKTELKNSDQEIVPLEEAFEYDVNQFWVVVPSKSKNPVLPAGNYTLNLEFNGRLDRDILGFYMSTYTDAKGINHKMATSKFQPTYARRAFPCFDEPTYKSTFKITLVKPSAKEYIALSNMPVEISIPNAPMEGFTEVTFQVSVPMVTYLAIFVVCDFNYIDAITEEHKIPFRVYGTEQQIGRLQYSKDIGTAIADYYETYFNIPYPLPKLDMAAIPDYSSGATEHWGLITYRETNLIYDPKESSAVNKERVAMVIAHEMAHQWFGNLMTVKWWNDLWLNEGFATYIEYKGVKHYEKDWDMDSMFLTSDLHRVLELDATKSSHSIVVDVDTPDQINAVFDTIAYSKGASVIRMMENFLGENDFRKGLTNFLTKFSFKTAVTQDLLDELTAVSSENLNVSSIMDTWTRQKGFPVVVLKRLPNGDYVGIQERFFASQNDSNDNDEPSPFNYKWDIPITYITSKQPDKKSLQWFNQNHQSIAIETPNLGVDDWIKFNVGQCGYYRVQYPIEDWIKFSEILQKSAEVMSSSDRTSLINDAFALAESGRLEYSQALDLTLYLGPNERYIAPWTTAFLAIDNMADVLYFDPLYVRLTQYLSSLLKTPYEEVGWTAAKNETLEKIKLRTLILKKMSTYGTASKIAGQLLLTWKQTGEKIADPDLREIVYRFGMKDIGDADVWNWMLELYKNETNAQEKQKLLLGLSSIAEPWILYHLLELASADSSIVRSQDYFTLLIYMSWNPIGKPIVWDFVRNNWLKLVDRFTLNDRYMGRMISEITKSFATPRRLQEMKDFFEVYPEAGAGENYRKIAVETVKNNIIFVESKHDQIENWLTKQGF